MTNGTLGREPIGVRSVQIAHTALAGFGQYAVDEGHVDRNTMHAVCAPRAPRQEAISPEMGAVQQLRELAEREERRLYSFRRLLTYAGIRRSEGIGPE